MILKRGRVQDFSVPPSNPNATKEARLLYARLKNCFGQTAGAECPLFIGVNETASATPYYEVNGNRVEALAGKTPLFMAPFWTPPGSNGYAQSVARAKEHYLAGGMVGTIWQPNNYLTGGSNYDRDKSSYAAVTECLSPSGSLLAAYRAKLDEFADSLNNDYVVDGVKIPLLCRVAAEANGWADYPDMTVDSLTRSGSVATVHFTRGASPLSSNWAAGSHFQIRGASDSRWNKMWTISSWVADGDGNGGAATFACAGNETSNPAGTITCYLTAGYYWAGADRVADLNTLMQQTIAYLRDVKGCNQLLWGPNLFTWNRSYLTSNPATYSYSLWLSGMESYYDFVAVNLYQDADPVEWPYINFGHQAVVAGFQPYVDWCNQHGRPVFIYEFGAKVAGATSADFWSSKCFDAFDASFKRLAGVTFWSPTFLPTDGTPAVADFQTVLSRPRYQWLPG